MPKPAKHGAHRKRREPSPLPYMLVHQDGSTHEWVPGQHWDFIMSMDDATNEHYSMFFVEEEGTQSSFWGVPEVIEAVITGLRRKRAARLIKSILLSSDGRLNTWGET